MKAMRSRIEFPAGKLLYEAERGVSHLRFSPQGDPSCDPPRRRAGFRTAVPLAG